MIDCFIIGPNIDVFAKNQRMRFLLYKDKSLYENLDVIKIDGKHYMPMQVFKRYNPHNLDVNILYDMVNPAVAYLGTFLKKNGFSFDYVNSFIHEKEKLAKCLKDTNIRTIAITTTYYTDDFPIKEIITFIRKINPNIPLIIGGPFIYNNQYNLTNDKFADILKSIDADFYVCSAQGEKTLVNLLLSLQEDKNLENVENIYYKKNKEYYYTKFLLEQNSLEENMVDWSLFKDKMGSCLGIRTAISCPFRCSFCERNKRFGKFQPITINRFEKELDSIKEYKTVKGIRFLDDCTNFPVERFKEMLKLIIRNKYRFKWFGFAKAKYLDEEVVELMKKSGCVAVNLGLESGNQEILNNMDKNTTLNEYKTALTLLKEYNIVSSANFIVGFPGETESTCNDTVSFIEEMKPDFYILFLWFYSPFAKIGESQNRFNIKGSGWEWSHSTMDSDTARDLRIKMYLSIKNSQYFHVAGDDIHYLLVNGYSVEQIKQFYTAYNNGIKELINNPNQVSVSNNIIEQLKLYQEEY